MSNSLGFDFDTQYQENRKFFSDGKEEINVWVESKSDINFWNQILNKNSNRKYEFKIMEISKFGCEKSADGCKKIIALCKNNSLILGKYNICCLDSDLNYIYEKYNGENFHGYISEYIFYTIVYSRENVILNREMFSKLLNRSTNNSISVSCSEAIFDNVVDFLDKFSKYIKYLISMSIYKNNDSEYFIFGRLYEKIISAINSITIDEENSLNNIDEIIEEIDKEYEKNKIDIENLDRVKEFVDVFFDQNPCKTYLFIKGHDIEGLFCKIFSNIVVLEMKKEEKIIKEKFSGEFISNKIKEMKKIYHKDLLKIIHLNDINTECVSLFNETEEKIKEFYME